MEYDIDIIFMSKERPMIPPIEATALPEKPEFAALLAECGIAARKGERTRAAIRAAGCRLLNDRPLRSLTVAAVCKEAWIAHGTFYIYFADLGALVGDILRDFVAFLQAEMRAASHGPGRDPVRSATAAYFSLFEANPGLMRCLVGHLDDFPEAREAFHTLNRQWAETVVDAAAKRTPQGGTVPPRPELLRRAYALGGMVDQYLTALLLHRDPTLAAMSEDREATIDTLTLIWKRGMAV